MFNDDNLRHEVEHGDQSEYADLPPYAPCYRYSFILVPSQNESIDVT